MPSSLVKHCMSVAFSLKITVTFESKKIAFGTKACFFA